MKPQNKGLFFCWVRQRRLSNKRTANRTSWEILIRIKLKGSVKTTFFILKSSNSYTLIKSSEAYEKTVQSQVTAYEINEKDKDVTFEKLIEKHYLDGPADKASTAPNGKKIVIANGKATLQK